MRLRPGSRWHRWAAVALLSTTLGQAAAAELSEVLYLTEQPVVLSGSRLDQPIMDAPNAITVIDRRMIEASGFRELSELFRLVPGFQVALMGGYLHAVTHGLSDEYSRRMQVLVDGHSVYLPSFGGVRWDMLPLALDDIERIEVSRGPNAATYGANAFTGIINIITRHPQDVSRHLAVVQAGQPDLREAFYRYGGGSGPYQFRLTVGNQENDGFDGQNDFMQAPMLNFRGEYQADVDHRFSLDFGLRGGERGLRADPSLHRTETASSANVHGGWHRQLDDGGTFEVRFGHQQTANSEDYRGVIALDIDVETARTDAEVQWTQVHAPNLRSVVGAGFRRDAVSSAVYMGTPQTFTSYSRSVFGHLEWRPMPAWLINLGAMLESSDLGGERASPRVSLHWQPAPAHSFRLGMSRAFRNPVRFEQDGYYVYASKVYNMIISSGGLKPETVTSMELAYLGVWPAAGVSLDMRLFKDAYSSLIGLHNYKPLPIPKDYENADWATLQGLDGQLRWRIAGEDTQVIANVAYTESRSSNNLDRYVAATPDHQYGLLAMHRFGGALDVSLGYYWTDNLWVNGGSPVPSARRMDLRIAHPIRLGTGSGELALVLQGLASPYHEYDDNDYNRFTRRGYVSFKVAF